MRWFCCFLFLFILFSFAGCNGSYVTPGGPANFAKLGVTDQDRRAATDVSIRKLLDKKPLVTFPATLAVVRVQSAGYRSYTYSGRQRREAQDQYDIVSTRDVEDDKDFEALGRLPDISGVVSLKRILVSPPLDSDMALREAAAKLHANLLLFYTFDTNFDTETRVQPLGVITLGLFPNENAKVTSTVSAVLMDVNNGYIYAAVEATSKAEQLTNAWESEQSMDDARRRAERDAFKKALGEFGQAWPGVVATYDKKEAKTAKE